MRGLALNRYTLNINASLFPTPTVVFGFSTSISNNESCIVVIRGNESRMIVFLNLFRPNRRMSHTTMAYMYACIVIYVGMTRPHDGNFHGTFEVIKNV